MKSKLQKGDQDIFEAYTMVDEIIGNIESPRKKIDSDFQIWYKEILDLARKLGIVEAIPRKTSMQRNRSNTPVLVQLIITKNPWLFPFLTI